MTRSFQRGAAVGLAMILALPVLSWAHAHLTRSEPAANARLAVAPAIIRLWFSEAPEVKLSSITLKDSSGAAIRLGELRRGDSTVEIEAAILDTLKAGRYTVGWRVAGSDGHPMSGAFSFSSAPTVVAAAPIPVVVARDDAGDARDNPAESLAYVAARAVGFASLLIVIGAVAFHTLVVGRMALADVTRARITRGLANAGATAAVVALISAAARLALQWQMLNGDAAATRIHLSTMTMETQWGGSWLIQAAALVVALAAFPLARGGARAAWALAGLTAVILAFTPALAGHAAAATSRRFASIGLDGVHVLGASIWLGSVFCMVAVAVPALATSDDGWQSIASLVNTFSPVALGAAGAVLVTGLATAWLRLGGVGPLFGTGYGRALLVKLLMLVGVAGVGAYNWRRMRPSLGTAEATRRFRTSATAELSFGVAVLVVTAVLVALPIPAN